MTTAQTEARAMLEADAIIQRWHQSADPSLLRVFIAAALAAKEAEMAALKKEASKFAEWVQDYSNDGHLARAARSFLDKWEGRE